MRRLMNGAGRTWVVLLTYTCPELNAEGSLIMDKCIDVKDDIFHPNVCLTGELHQKYKD